MSNTTLREKIIVYLQDAHAMEQNMLGMLDSMSSTTKNRETLVQLRRHRQETERHERLLKDRLDELGASRPLVAASSSIAGTTLKVVANQTRADKPAKNAHDGFVAEQSEIAAYELLERLAQRLGDAETVRIARTIRQDEEKMAEWIAARWDQFVDLTLEEAGLSRAEVLV